MLTDVITFPGKPYTYHIKVSSIQSGTSSKPSTAAVAGSNRDGQRSGEKRLPPMANANPVLAASNQLEAVRVRAGLELQRTSNVNTVIRVASLGRNANRANQRAARHHFLLSSNQAYLSPSGGYVELKHLGLDCVHVGQCWLDTGIALVGNKEVSFRLYCQRESIGEQQHALVIRLGNGGRMRAIKDGDFLIGLRARPEVSKKGHVHWTAIDCICVISNEPQPVLVSCGVAVLKKDPSTGKCWIAMKRSGQSIGFVSMRRQLKRYFTALASYREPLLSAKDIANHFFMCCDFELELLSKPMTASNIRCLFDSRSPGPITYNEAWTSMFDKHQLYPIPALSLLEMYARLSLTCRSDTNEDLRRPWTLPKGNFRHMAASGLQSPAHCAVRELKAETSLEWNLDECQAAPAVIVPLPDSTVAEEMFFLWRNDNLKNENGGQVGEKYWQWFEFDEARRRSTTAKAILLSPECHRIMGLVPAPKDQLTVPLNGQPNGVESLNKNVLRPQDVPEKSTSTEQSQEMANGSGSALVENEDEMPLITSDLLAGLLKGGQERSENDQENNQIDASAVTEPSVELSDDDRVKDPEAGDTSADSSNDDLQPTAADTSAVSGDSAQQNMPSDDTTSPETQSDSREREGETEVPPDQTDLGITYDEATGQLNPPLEAEVESPQRVWRTVTTV